MIKLRSYEPDDCLKILSLFHDTIHSINAKDYTKPQLNAWAPEDIDSTDWKKSLNANHTLVAETENQIVGFGDLTANGVLDRLHVHKDFQSQGIATAILQELENHAHNLGFEILTTDASITAKPFFTKRGYQSTKEQQVERRGQFLTNFLMTKKLEK